MMTTDIEVLGKKELSMGTVFLNIQMDQSTLEDSIKASNMDKDISSHQVAMSTMGNG